MRGVSRRGVLLTLGCLAAYLTVRLAFIGVPHVGERASGFGFSRLEPADINRRFGQTGHLYYFYAYNVVSAFVSVFLSDPASGRWRMLEQVVHNRVDATVIITLVSALVATALIVRFAVQRRGAWATRRFDADDQLVLLCLAIAAGNAAISFSYVKDEVMSTAGVFYALAAYAATRVELARWNTVSRTALTAVAMTVMMFIGGMMWSIRAAGLHYQLLRIATVNRYEWAHVDEWLEQQRRTPTTTEGRQLVAQLRDEAMATRPVSLLFVPRWAVRWFNPE
jgi:hypothetical protein